MSVVPAMLAERLGLPQVTFASELTVEGDVGDDPPRRRRRRRETVQASLPAARVGDRPDQRAALPLVQGDHGGQEEAGRDAGRWPTSASTPSYVGLGGGVDPGGLLRPAAAAHAGARSSRTRARAARKLAEFLAAQKFI